VQQSPPLALAPHTQAIPAGTIRAEKKLKVAINGAWARDRGGCQTPAAAARHPTPCLAELSDCTLLTPPLPLQHTTQALAASAATSCAAWRAAPTPCWRWLPSTTLVASSRCGLRGGIRSGGARHTTPWRARTRAAHAAVRATPPVWSTQHTDSSRTWHWRQRVPRLLLMEQ
jgi:hypothetical protein